MKTLAPTKVWLTPKQVGQQLGFDEKTIRDWLDAGEMTHQKYRGSYRVEQAVVDEYERRHTVLAVGKGSRAPLPNTATVPTRETRNSRDYGS